MNVDHVVGCFDPMISITNGKQLQNGTMESTTS
jgi:hypothetical protein